MQRRASTQHVPELPLLGRILGEVFMVPSVAPVATREWVSFPTGGWNDLSAFPATERNLSNILPGFTGRASRPDESARRVARTATVPRTRFAPVRTRLRLLRRRACRRPAAAVMPTLLSCVSSECRWRALGKVMLRVSTRWRWRMARGEPVAPTVMALMPSSAAPILAQTSFAFACRIPAGAATRRFAGRTGKAFTGRRSLGALRAQPFARIATASMRFFLPPTELRRSIPPMSRPRHARGAMPMSA